MAKKNTQEHKSWLKQRIQEDIDNWEQNIEFAKESGQHFEGYFEAEIAFAKRALRWLKSGQKPSQVEDSYIKVIKTLKDARDVIKELNEFHPDNES
jgi:hypothetical protein